MLAASVLEDSAAAFALHRFDFVDLRRLAYLTSAVDELVTAPALPMIGIVTVLALRRPVLLGVLPQPLLTGHLSRDGILPQLITTAIRGGELTRRPVPEVIEILDALILANVTIQSLVSPTRSSNVKHHTAYFSKRWKLFLSVASPG